MLIIAIIQARMGSTRLPGKVMLDICEKPVLWHIAERVKKSKYIDKIVIATSIETVNDEIREFCNNNNLLCYSGSEEDVLDRYYKALINNEATDDDIIIRITGDCPLIDYEIIDKIIEELRMKNADYASNVMIPTYPDGLDCECMKFSTLKMAWECSELKSEREHVTLYIRNHPEIFNIVNIKNEVDLSSLRWTLDQKEDYKLINFIYEKLYYKSSDFLMKDILKFLDENPNLSKINSKYIRNEGLLKSLLNEGKNIR